MCLATVQLLASGRPSGARDADDAPCATCTIEACSNVEVKHHAEERFRDPSVPSSTRWGESLDVNDEQECCIFFIEDVDTAWDYAADPAVLSDVFFIEDA